MAKTRKIKFELLVVTEDETKRKGWKPPSVWRTLIFTEPCRFLKRLFIGAVVIFAYALTDYSDDLTKRILTWFINN